MNNFEIKRQDFAKQFDGTESFNVCVWPIAERYKSVAGWIYPEGRWRLSFPLDDPNLFLSFARLGADPSDKSVQRWVSKRGLLRGSDSQRSAASRPYEQGTDGRIIADQASTELVKLKAEIGQARDLLDFYAELQSRDIEAIRARVATPRTAIDRRLYRRQEWSGLRGEASRACEGHGGTPGYEWNLWVATNVLADELTEVASGIRLRATLRDKIEGLSYSSPYTDQKERDPFFEPPYALRSTWYCPDLLSAIYLQFYLMVTQHRSLRRCENPACGLPFPAIRKDKRFCNATCRSNARNYR